MRKAILAILVLLLALGLLSLLPLDWAALRAGDLPAAAGSLRQSVDAAGPLAWALFLLVFTLLPLLMVPVSILCLAGGLLFPWYLAFPLVWLGSTLSAAASYLLARTVARRLVERLFLPRLAFLRQMDARAGGHGFKASLLSRFLPFPYVFPGYAAGISQVSFWDFTLGSAVGMLPWSLLYALAARSLTGANLKLLALAGAGLAFLMLAALLVRQRLGLRRDGGGQG
jgi:uncharacterized membrane protein YdjX (TVP38/TMEM64 family)